MAKNPKEKLDGLALEILIRDLVNDLNTKTLTQLNSQQQNINTLKGKQVKDQNRIDEAQQKIKLLIKKFDMKEKIDADSNVRKNQFNNLEREFAIHERYIGEKVAKVHDEHYLL